MGSAKKKILYVEDEAALREVILELLRGEGFECYEAENGLAAMAVLMSHQDIDVLITDFRMPRMNGSDLLEWCREKGYHLPVIFLTATDELVEDEVRALGDCCADMLRKPVGIDVLISAIYRALERNHVRECQL